MLPVKMPRDPAPSRVKYRLERLWLRPAVRNFVRLGLPGLVLLAGVIWLVTNPAIRAGAAGQVQAMRDRIAAHPGLMVNALVLPDASPAVAQAIRRELALDLPISSMDLDLSDLHATVAGIGAVASAQVRLTADGNLEVSVTERVPALVWRSPEGHMLLDHGGIAIESIPSRAARQDLPLVIGTGADAQAAQAVRLLAQAAPVADRIRALSRIGQRRWDLVLSPNLVVQLPAADPMPALARVMALHDAEDLLDKDVAVIDMRDGRRPTLRLTPQGMTELLLMRAAAADEG